MTTELEQEQQKRIEHLESQLRLFKKMEEHLVPLPNGDLHRGFKTKPDINLDVDKVPEALINPLDRAIAKCLQAAKGGEPLTCLWCGMQYGVMGPQNLGAEKMLRDHLKKDHASVVEGYDKAVPEILMANLQEANERLAAASA